MAQTYTKNYNSNVFSDFISDLQSAYDWKNVEIAEDGSYAKFYVNETIRIVLWLTNSVIKFQIVNNGSVVTEQSANGYFITKTVKTNKAFCFTFMTSTSSTNILPTGYLNHIIIGTAVNQLTGTEETALAYVNQYGNSSISGYILSSDNLTETVITTNITTVSNNFGAKVTSMQNIFGKYSECIMKDVYILTSLQFPSFSFNDCTLNNKKYYMNGAILLADD